MGNYIEIREEDEVFDYVAEHPVTGEPTSTILQLRVVPKAIHRHLIKKATKYEFRNHERVEVTDWVAVTEGCLDYAIVGWTGVKLAKTGEDMPCDLINKLRLPERLRLSVMSMCVGREVRTPEVEDPDALGEAKTPHTDTVVKTSARRSASS